MVSRWCKNITFIVHFISNLMLLLIWQKVLVHGLEFGDSCAREPSSFLIFFVKLISVCILASKTIMKQLKIYKLSINSTFSLADWKSTYVIFSWHFLALFWFLVLANTFAKVKVLVTQLCPTFCDPVDCSPPGSSPHEILQARILEWVAIPFSKESSQPRNWTQVSCITGIFSMSEPPGKPTFSQSL